MSNMVLLFLLMFVLVVLSAPIGIALGVSTAVVMACTTNLSLSTIIQNSFTGLNSFTLLAIPFFILAGNLMSFGGISKRLVIFCDSLLGWITGGLGIVTTAACMLFAAISGSGPATVSAIGGMMIPEMEKRGYDKDFSAALSASAGTIGVIIPPSIPFVIYGVVASASIGDLFLAGVVPGILIGLALMVVCYVTARKRGWKGVPRKELPKPGHAFLDGFWALLAPVIILGGIYGGIFTPTEASVIAVFYSFAVGKFIYKELDLKLMIGALTDTAKMTGMIGLAMGLSLAFASFLAMEQVPAKLGAFLSSTIQSDVILILLIIAILLFVGCFVDNISSCLILTPVFLPLVNAIGYSTIHFGIIMTIALAIGFVTPPFGGNLFVASAVAGLPIEKIARRAVFMLLAMLLILLLVTFIPGISMGLVNLVKS